MKKVVVTAAITGAGDTIDKNENVPVTPQELADSAIKCAKAGATVAHIHVRDPKTGGVSHDPELYSATLSQVNNTQKQAVKEPGFKHQKSVIDQ